MQSTLLSLLMLAGLALAAGAAVIWRRGDRRRAGLMLIAALVMFANVAIWLVPGPGSASVTPPGAAAGLP